MKTHLLPNKGPLLFDVHPDDKMTYFQMGIDDYLSGVRTLKPGDVGIYTIICALMYKHMGSLRDDDRYIAGHCNCDLRTYRSHRRALIASGKIFEADGFLYNNRVLVEVAKFCATTQKKREAAKLREQQKRSVGIREQRTLPVPEQELRKNCADFAPSVHQVCTNPEQDVRNFCQDADEKHSDINVGCTTAVPRHRHSPLKASAKQAGEKEKEEDSPPKGGSRLAKKSGEGCLDLGMMPPIERVTAPPLSDIRDGETEIAPGVYRSDSGIRHKSGYFAIDFGALKMQLVLANLGMSTVECDALGRQLAEAKAIDWAARIAAGQPSRDVVPRDPVGALRGTAANMRAAQRKQAISPKSIEVSKADAEATAALGRLWRQERGLA